MKAHNIIKLLLFLLVVFSSEVQSQSRRNLSSELIDTMRPTYALISAKGGSDTKHPRKALVFCLRKHGAKVYSTSKSGSLRHKFGDFPERNGYSTAEEVFKS